MKLLPTDVSPPLNYIGVNERRSGSPPRTCATNGPARFVSDGSGGGAVNTWTIGLPRRLNSDG
jgi:hypothetical protein